MVALFGPDLVKEHRSLMLFPRSSRTESTSRTVARKRLKRNVTTPFVMPVRALAPVEEYVGVVDPKFNPVDVNSPDVHRKYYGERCGGAWNDPPR